MQVVLLISGYYSSAILEIIIESFSAFEGMDAPAIHTVFHHIFSWLGAAILGGLGINMLCCYFNPATNGKALCYSGRLGLIVLAFSVSVDALTAGFGLGMLEFDARLPLTSLVVGVVIWLMALIGLTMGRQIYRWIGHRAQLVGGILLLYLALYFVLTNL